MPETTTEYCAACGSFQAVGSTWRRAEQLRHHWLSCRGVESLTFHPDGTLAGVVFK